MEGHYFLTVRQDVGALKDSSRWIDTASELNHLSLSLGEVIKVGEQFFAAHEGHVLRYSYILDCIVYKVPLSDTFGNR